MDYQKHEIGSNVTAKRNYNGEIITGEFGGFHLLDKSNPKSIVGVVHTPNGSYDVEPYSIESAISKDEKLREQVVYAINQLHVCECTKDKLLAWLEKQEDTNKEYWRGYREGKQEIIDKYSELEKQGEQKPNFCHHEVDFSNCSEEYRKAYYDGWNNCNQQRAQLEAEQNPTDKVEPKFKAGDWCIDNEDGTIFQIVKVLNNTYRYKTNEGYEYSCTHYSLENDAKLWTIKDAKDGDALVFDDAFILIFKEIIDLKLNPPLFKKVRGFYFKSYVNLDFMMNVFEQGNFCDNTGNSCQPATKEQRDLLFSKMEEAGYEWDAEKKELRKIGQKPAWSKEDERIQQCLIEDQERGLEAVINNKVGHSEIISDLKEMYHERLDWLKSIKDKVQPKPKQEWSEDDEEMFDAIIADIQFTQKAHNHEVNQVVYEREIDWLKSLKERMKGE